MGHGEGMCMNTGDAEYACNAYRVTVFFPLADNDGHPFERDIWNWWRDEITKLRFAFTELGVVRGYWEGYSEEHRWLFWIVASAEEVSRLRDFITQAKERFRQMEMFFEVVPVFYEGV